MKKIMSLLLALVLVLSMAACGDTNPTDPAPTDPAPTDPAPTDPAPTDPAPTDPAPTDPAAAAMSMVMLSSGEGMNMDTITIYDNDMGGLYVDFNVKGVRKVATLDLSLLAGLEAAVNDSGMMDLAGTEEMGEGTNSVSFYASYTDWSSVSVSYYGVEVPEAFTTAYNTLVAYIETMLADVPQYVPQAQVMGDVEATILTETQTIVNNAQITNLDMMAIQALDISDPEGFAWTAGLSSAEGISAGAICQNMMMGGGVYTLVMVKAADTAAVAADFETSMDWLKNICVQASNAVIATKGELVLCLMASDVQYTNTLSAMQDAGWTTVKELTNPNM